jgi:TonB family protein
MNTAGLQHEKMPGAVPEVLRLFNGNSTRAHAGILGIPFISSLAIHALLILFGARFLQHTNAPGVEALPIRLVELPAEIARPQTKPETPYQPQKRLPPPPSKADKPATIPKAVAVKPDTAPPAAPIEQEPEATEPQPVEQAKTEPSPDVRAGTRPGGGGSEPGAGNLSDKGEITAAPGGLGPGRGTAASGQGQGAGPPGLSATPTRVSREAKPVQTVRANYPPMALRAGLESDVGLRIEIDPEGHVTKAEITKSGGAGFDEEALKAVRQARFEPAQRDGHNVPAEFTYVYRFRLRR